MVQLTKCRRAIQVRITLAIFLTTVASCGPTNRMHSQQAESTKLYDSLLVDADGNRYLIKPFRDNNLWMTTNLQLNIPGSFCYENIEKNCEQYGRLYTWESGQKACALLGQGWRLPTNEDWQHMAKQYGGVRDDSGDKGNGAYKELLQGGTAGFNALLGGGRDLAGNYARLDGHGFYWTVTQRDTSNAWFYNFGKGSQMLNRHSDGEKASAFSVRCVKNINMSK